jgi:hypothetical protein
MTSRQNIDLRNLAQISPCPGTDPPTDDYRLLGLCYPLDLHMCQRM